MKVSEKYLKIFNTTLYFPYNTLSYGHMCQKLQHKLQYMECVLRHTKRLNRKNILLMKKQFSFGTWIAEIYVTNRLQIIYNKIPVLLWRCSGSGRTIILIDLIAWHTFPHNLWTISLCYTPYTIYYILNPFLIISNLLGNIFLLFKNTLSYKIC